MLGVTQRKLIQENISVRVIIEKLPIPRFTTMTDIILAHIDTFDILRK